METPEPSNYFVNFDSSHPFFLNSNDSPDDVLISMKLTGDNYLEWSQAMLIALQAKNKSGFIDGTIRLPHEDDPDFHVWKRVNKTVLSWLLIPINKDMAPINFNTESVATELWNDLLDRFSPESNIRFFYLQRAVADQRQGNDSLLVYFNKLKKFWDDLSVFIPNESNHVHQVMQFLVGLDETYAWFRRRILSIHPLPQIDELYSLILEYEAHHQESLESLEDSRIKPGDGGNESIESIDDKLFHVLSIESKEEGFSYQQESSVIDNSLVQTKNKTRGESRVIEHVSHKHPLFYTEYSYNTKKDSCCSNCQRALFGPIIYSCEECNFDLHQYCAEAPQEPFKYYGHPQHMLNFQASSSSDDGSFECHGCFGISQGFHYKCSLCDYVLDIDCALKPEFLAHESHPHLLILAMTSEMKYTRCDCCHLHCSGILSYICSQCEYYLHPTCASIPYTISYKMVDDDGGEITLKLAYSTFFELARDDFKCTLCDLVIHFDSWFYYSGNNPIPTTFAHLLCAIKRATRVPLAHKVLGETEEPKPSKKVKRTTELLLLHQESESNTDANTSRDMKNLDLEDNDNIHKPLILIDESERTKNLCYWCQQLLSGTTYGCKECETYVHKLCYESPDEIKHASHPNEPLILIPRVHIVECKACQNIIIGTGYGCRCPCYNFLHPQCALLPQETTYEQHSHKNFKLIYKIRKNCYLDKVTCHACEEPIRENWAYQCASCDYIAHMVCIVPSALRFHKR